MRTEKVQKFQPQNILILFKLLETSDFLSEVSELEPFVIIHEKLKLLGFSQFLVPPTLSCSKKRKVWHPPIFIRTFIYFIYSFIIITYLGYLKLLKKDQNFHEVSRSFV